MSKAKVLRKLISQKELLMAPGAYDVLSARLVEKAGFNAVYMTGYGVSASLLGRPDIGLITMSEMVSVVRSICSVTNIPLIADADTGYGGILNVCRTMSEYESAGAAGIQFEDQVIPKRCGHMEGKELVSKEEMATKIRAAVHARKNPDTVIIARTDARAVYGFDDAIDRSQAYIAAGADVIFFEAPQSVDEMREAGRLLKVPLIANMVENGKTPLLTNKQLEKLGYKIAIYPVTPLYAATKAIETVLAALKETGTNSTTIDQVVGFPDFNRLIGLQDLRELEKKFI